MDKRARAVRDAGPAPDGPEVSRVAFMCAASAALAAVSAPAAAALGARARLFANKLHFELPSKTLAQLAARTCLHLCIFFGLVVCQEGQSYYITMFSFTCLQLTCPSCGMPQLPGSAG